MNTEDMSEALDSNTTKLATTSIKTGVDKQEAIVANRRKEAMDDTAHFLEGNDPARKGKTRRQVLLDKIYKDAADTGATPAATLKAFDMLSIHAYGSPKTSDDSNQGIKVVTVKVPELPHGGKIAVGLEVKGKAELKPVFDEDVI